MGKKLLITFPAPGSRFYTSCGGTSFWHWLAHKMNAASPSVCINNMMSFDVEIIEEEIGMTEKVKLTREQAVAIETWTQCNGHNIDILLGIHADRVSSHGKGWVSDCYTSFNGLSQADMARALLIGYEVKEEYKVGDWVACDYDDGTWIVQIEKIEGEKVFARWEFDVLDWNRICDIRHATPEEIKAEQERRVWAKIGREIGEFVRGDAGLHKNGQTIRSTSALSTEYAMDNLKGFHPAESFVSFGGGEDA